MKNKKMHWAARQMIRWGTASACLVLLLGFGAEQGSFLAISVCKTAVMMFAVSVIGGILSDVVAFKKGMRE